MILNFIYIQRLDKLNIKYKVFEYYMIVVKLYFIDIIRINFVRLDKRYSNIKTYKQKYYSLLIPISLKSIILDRFLAIFIIV